MKELSTEEKAKRYDEAIKKAKYYYDEGKTLEYAIDIASDVFPELNESEDERIRKEITELVMQPTWKTEKEFHRRNELCAWLEKQGEQKPYGQRKECTDCQFNYAGECKGYCAMKRSEQKPTDKIEPKFKVGDWVVCKNGSHRVFQVIERSWPNAKYRDIKGTEIFLNVFTLDKQYRPWTIQDAKDGDVLAAHECLVLFKEIDGLNIRCYCTYHYMNHQKFYVDTLQNKTAFCPATKEQRDLLFSKMKEAGYEWDAEKKELKKIEQSPIDVRTTGYWNVEDVEQKPA